MSTAEDVAAASKEDDMSKDWTTREDKDFDAYRKKPDGTWNSELEKSHGNRVEGPQWQDTGAWIVPDRGAEK